MKKCVILVAILFSGILVAQETKPELEAVGNKVKATYYYDNGKGIDPKIRTKIFDPFVTTNRHKGGSGLGTYIVYNTVTQALRGQIILKEDVEAGVHFSINVPI